jgi:hypothetical protein
MTAITRRVGFATVLALSALVGAGGAMSDPSPSTFKPLQGVSLHLGSKHAIGYFVKGDNVCQLTLVVGEELVGEDVPAVTPSRFSAAIEAGRSARFDTGGGTQLQFGCAPSATAMTVETLNQVAYSAPRK